jgi:hypothetical protein
MPTESISTLECDVAECDQLIDAIRTELGPTRLENAALQQEIKADLEPLHAREVRREVVAQLRQQRDSPLRGVASDFQEESTGQRRSKGDGEGPTAQLYTGLFERLEAFCGGDELAEVSDLEYVVYEEDDAEVVERGRI